MTPSNFPAFAQAVQNQFKKLRMEAKAVHHLLEAVKREE